MNKVDRHLEHVVSSLARTFATEITNLEAHRQGTQLSLSLTVELKGWGEDAKPAMYLKANFRDPNASSSFSSNNVEASTLHTLLSEVKRRLAFEDNEAVAIESNNNSLSALSPPWANYVQHLSDPNE